MNQHIIQLTDTDFNQQIQNQNQPILVDFWADWCNPCKLLLPILEEIATEYQGRLIIAKVDVDAQPNIAQHYHIRSLPTLLLLKGGEKVATQIGSRSKAQLKTFLDGYL